MTIKKLSILSIIKFGWKDISNKNHPFYIVGINFNLFFKSNIYWHLISLLSIMVLNNKQKSY